MMVDNHLFQYSQFVVDMLYCKKSFTTKTLKWSTFSFYRLFALLVNSEQASIRGQINSDSPNKVWFNRQVPMNCNHGIKPVTRCLVCAWFFSRSTRSLSGSWLAWILIPRTGWRGRFGIVAGLDGQFWNPG